MATATNRHLSSARSGVRARRAAAVTVAALLAGPALATLPAVAAVAAPGAAAPGAVGASSRTSVHLDNPYVGARPYVDPNWAARAASEPGGSQVSRQPTAVWLDSVASIRARPGSGYTTSLRRHLENALAQRATLIQFAIHNRPGRDCVSQTDGSAPSGPTLEEYRSDYIDRIAAIQADPRYSSLRIVNLIEPGSLTTVLQNAASPQTSACAVAVNGGDHQSAIVYALATLHAAGANNYEYLDASDHSWTGYDTNLAPAAALLADLARRTPAGTASVDGVITNAANYSTLAEPWFDITTTVGGASVRQSKFVDWNLHLGESSVAAAFRAELLRDGFPTGTGVIIDTSRNGWGGPARPTAAIVSTDVNTFVNQSRVDRRTSTLLTCNQAGAGLGERPRPAPAPGIDAYVWAKAPGVSDGSPVAVAAGPANPAGKVAERLCTPGWVDTGRATPTLTGALADPPVYGAWFPAHFRQLLANAYPPL